MINAQWVMYAGMAAWTGIGIYVFYLSRKQAALLRRMEQLSQLLEDHP